MTKVEILEKAIAGTEDEATIKSLNDELITAIKEEALEKARAEVAVEAEKSAEAATAKAVADAREKSAQKNVTDFSEVKVIDTDNYHGYNLKMATDLFTNDGRVSSRIRAKALADPKSAENVCKYFIDIHKNAVRGPAEINKAMSEGTAAAGGYLTPIEQRMSVLSYIRDTSIALADCSHIPMSSDTMTIPRELGKVTVSYTSEATDATEASATFDQVSLTATRMDAYTKVSNELINDADNPGGIAGLLAGQFLEAIGQKVDSTVFKGTGSPVSGVFVSAGSSEVFSSGSTAFSELLESNLRNAIAKIRPNRRANAKWYGATSVLWQYIKGLKDDDGRPLYYDPVTGGAGTGNVLGYPMREGNDDIMPSTSAAATAMLVFGDLSGFIIGDRLTNMTLFEDPYSFARSYQTQYLLFTRWAFAHGLPSMYTKIQTAAS